MANDDIYNSYALGLVNRGPFEDLNQFQTDLARNNYYRIAAAPISNARFNTSTWSPWTTAGTAFAQALLSGGLNRLGQQYEAEQLQMANDLLPALYRNPESVSIPEGGDAEAFGGLIANAKRERALREAKNLERDQEMQLRFMNDLFTRRPELMPDNMKSSLGIQLEQERRAPLKDAPNGPESVQDKFSRLYNNFVAQGQPPGAATDAALKMVEADRKLLASDVTALEQSREKLRSLDNLIATAEVGVRGAGETGGAFGGIRDLASSVYAALPDVVPGAAEEAQQRASQRTLESIAPDVIAAARVAGAGAMSDREMASYLASGPSVANTPEQNTAILEKLRNLGNAARDYNDFREWYREEFGSLSGSSRVWDAYKAANPLVVDGEWNSARQPWTEFVATAMQGGAEPSRVTMADRIDPMAAQSGALPAIGSTFQGSRVVNVKKIR